VNDVVYLVFVLKATLNSNQSLT